MQCKKCGSELASEWLVCPFCGRAINYTPKPKKRGNGQGTAYKRGNTWTAQVTQYITVDDDGKLKQKLKRKGGFKTKKEALQYIDALHGSEERKIPTLLELYSVWEKTELPNLSKDKQSV